MKNYYKRVGIKAVTVFIYHNDKYLFLKRNSNNKVDPDKLNGIGGKLELGENFVDAAIRETEEETGLIITEKDLKFCGMDILEKGSDDDWIICIFKLKVNNEFLPLGNKTEDGEFLWLKSEQIINHDLELVDDLNYSFQDIVDEKVFFMTCIFDKDGKVSNFSKSII